jgi:uncharacterized protein YidB (DUF937 family)
LQADAETKEDVMGLFDSVSKALGGTPGQSSPGAPGADFISAILTKTDLGSLHGIVGKLQAAGLDRQVQSWLGSGSNLPITAEQLRGALGNEQVQQVARQLGLPIDAALQLMADQMPKAVDEASPNGALSPR